MAASEKKLIDDLGSNDGLDLLEMTMTVEAFNRVFIRLSSVQRLSLTTLSVLHTLERSQPMNLTELTATEQVTQPAMTQLVTRLVNDGLVERMPDPRDRRSVLVKITQAGAESVRARRTSRIAKLAPLIAELTSQERQAIAAALPALRRIVEVATAEGLVGPTRAEG
jgi:DNA-binding MarR family transcriptional regulator